jgi:translation elongation factor EF-Tu-like GTPase
VSRRLDNYRTQLQRDLEHIAGTLNLPAGMSIAMPGELAVARVALPQAAPCRGRDSPSENGRTVGAGRVTTVSP